MVRTMLTATAFLIGAAAMSPAVEPDVQPEKPKSPYTTRVTYRQVVNGKVANETKGVEAFRRDVDGAVKWQLNGKQIRVQVQPGDRIVDDQGATWVVVKASTTTGGLRVICEVTKGS
jgi:hypothetical protein